MYDCYLLIYPCDVTIYSFKPFNPFSAGTAFMLMQTGCIQASRRVTQRLA